MSGDTEKLTAEDLPRYARQLALPDFDMAAQTRLKNAHILVVGAGGLGAAALPYLAGAGIGRITLCDDDTASLSNLHRQTIFTTAQIGQKKAELTASYLRALNPAITVETMTRRLRKKTIPNGSFSLIIDGSDNFETKTLLNTYSIESATPLLGASVNRYAGQCGLFAGYAGDRPCYHCLFPQLPTDARNCNEAGVLGTAAGLTGLYQAHLAILFLAGLDGVQPGDFYNYDYRTMRIQSVTIPKDPSCPHCRHGTQPWTHPKEKEKQKMAAIISLAELQTHDHVIVDVRTDIEILSDPVAGAVHIELTQIPHRHEELPKDKLLAFVCAGNIRSAQAADYLSAIGYDNVVVLDKFSL